MQVGRYGVWISSRGLDAPAAAAAARLAEELGFGTLWLGGSPKLDELRPLLAASERLVVATGILNVWANEPAAVAASYAELAGEFPGRVLLGIGIGHPEATGEYARPLETMTAFLDGLDAAPVPVPPDGRCLAALGPRMLDLSRERTLGSHTYFVPVAHTRWAREQLGADKLLAVELACVLDEDDARARRAARVYAEFYLRLRNYATNLRRHGFDASDLAEGGSERLLDALVPRGAAETAAALAREHLDAGASHVCLQPVGVDGLPGAQWEALARALRGA
jgi:probable F420-dependent oxidoreductase